MPRKKREMTEEEQIKFLAYHIFLMHRGLKDNFEGKNQWNELTDEWRDRYMMASRQNMEEHKRMVEQAMADEQ